MVTDIQDRFVVKQKKEIYSDFLSNLETNPVTGLLAKATNEQAVKQSIRNLVMTTKTERFQRSDIGSKIRSLLFEPIDTNTEELLRTTITETIRNNEPRAKVVGVVVQANAEMNAYNIMIYFEILNLHDQEFSLSLVLHRVR